jgi:hypothetical protein
MPALFALGFAIDVVVIYGLGGSGFCFTPAYAMLLPAYGVMWAAGRFAAARLHGSLPQIAVLFAAGSGFGTPRAASISWAGALPIPRWPVSCRASPAISRHAAFGADLGRGGGVLPWGRASGRRPAQGRPR